MKDRGQGKNSLPFHTNMVDVHEQFEQIDVEGSSVIYTGTVGTSSVPIPSSPTNLISEFLVIAYDKKLYISFDDSTFLEIEKNGFFAWTPKNTRQIYIKGSAASTSYAIVMNLEPF